MKKQSGWRSWFGAWACVAAMVAPAAAATVDFEDLSPTVFAGDSIVSGGLRFTSDGFGLSGIDATATFAFGDAPANATGQFLFSLFSDGMYMDDPTGEPFVLVAFDVAFLAPFPGLDIGFPLGELHVLGLLADGSDILEDVFALPASDASGNFPFARQHTSNLAGQPMSVVAFFACVYTDQGCDFNATGIPPQFALDNIKVPEPASAALALAALGLMVAARLRRHG